MTGVWYAEPEADCDFTAELPAAEHLKLAPKPWKWIWSNAGAAQSADYGTVYFYKSFRLPKVPDEAVVVASGDSAFTLYVNGVRALVGGEWQKAASTNIHAYLLEGENIFTVEAMNLSEHTPAATGPGAQSPVRKPAGFALYARLRQGNDVLDVGTDASWKWSVKRASVMDAAGASPRELMTAAELGGIEMPPWSMGAILMAKLSKVLVRGRVRAGMVSADPLALAMGRPLREQVVSSRSSAATALQALEFVNGDTLSGLIEQGAANLLAARPKSSALFVQQLFVQALSRPPSPRESQLCVELLGPNPGNERVRDLLWSIVLLPEFQLIY
jgi:hypothetical protein